MDPITFRLQDADLANYRYAVRDRLNAIPNPGLLGTKSVRWLLLFALSFALMFALDRIAEALTGAPLAIAPVLIGMLFGAALVLAALWLAHFDQAAKLVKPDGPTKSEHAVGVTTPGLSVTAPHLNATYAWSAIDDVTVARGLVLIWLEPALALVIPSRVFPSREAEAEFIAAVNGQRNQAELPRAGSFSAA